MNEIPQHANKEKDVWQTPNWLWKGIAERVGGFDLDPCAGPDTEIADRNLYIGRGEDGLDATWKAENVFVNPPFSEKADWLEKVVDEKINYERCFVITPDSTDTKSWWHEYIAEHADYVWFPYGRVGYYDPIDEKIKGSPSFGSAVSVFGDIPQKLMAWF
jgi:phage N-6-adenine-methyltransferase